MQRRRFKALVVLLITVIVLLNKPMVVTGSSVSINVSADNTKVAPGDVISFSVTLGPVNDMGTMQMKLVIPEGLSFIDGSGKLATGLRDTLGFDSADFAESTRLINGYASKADYSSDGYTLICTFQCKAVEGYSGTVEVGLSELEFYSCETWEDHTGDFYVNKAVIHIEANELAPSHTEDPDQQTEPQPEDGGSQDDQASTDDTKTEDNKTSGDNTTPDSVSSNGSTPSEDIPQNEKEPEGNTAPDPDEDNKDSDKEQENNNGSAIDPSRQESEGQTVPEKANQIVLVILITAAIVLASLTIALIIFARKKTKQ